MQNFSFFRRTIPLASRYNKGGLTLIFTFLVFLLVFVVSCMLLFGCGFHKWGASESSNLTVEIPLNFTEAAAAPAAMQQHQQQVAAVTQILQRMPGVQDVQPVSPEKLRSMLAQWAGETNLNQNFALPTLLDVKVDIYKIGSVEALTQQLRNVAANIRVENHSVWAQKLMLFSHSLQTITVLVGGFVLLCVSIIVALITRTSLQAYYATLDTLRLLGAKDAYVARIFQSQVGRSSAIGGSVGGALAVPTVYGLLLMMRSLGLSGIGWNTALLHVMWAVVLVPLVVYLLSVIISRITVLTCLRRLDA